MRVSPLTIGQYASKYRVTQGTVRMWIKDGKIYAIKMRNKRSSSGYIYQMMDQGRPKRRRRTAG